MPVLMVCVGCMRVGMDRGVVRVAMAVAALRGLVVPMQMVPVVVRVGVFVFDCVVCMLVQVAFGQVQRHARKHEHAASHHEPSCGPITEPEGHCCANEGGKGEH